MSSQLIITCFLFCFDWFCCFAFFLSSFSTLQYSRRSKTQWHKPLTNAIFSSHFKETSRNGEFHIDQLVAKGAFGVVFRVIDKNSTLQQQQHKIQKQEVQQGLTTYSSTYTSTTSSSFSTADNLCSTSVYALKVLKKSKVCTFQ